MNLHFLFNNNLLLNIQLKFQALRPFYISNL